MAKELTGVLFKNDKKTTDKHPVYKGQCMVNGQEFWMSAWINEHPEKGKYMSLKFEAKEQRAAPRSGARRTDDGEDIPFAPIGKVESSLL